MTDAPDRPQPRRDVMAGNGMTVTVGRVREDAIFDLRLTAMGHNTIRGAAGGSVLNAELLVASGRLGWRPPARAMIVVKFGGTSVGDADAIARTAAIVRGRLARKPVVVVSALAGTTNALIEIADRSAGGQLIVALSCSRVSVRVTSQSSRAARRRSTA